MPLVCLWCPPASPARPPASCSALRLRRRCCENSGRDWTQQTALHEAASFVVAGHQRAVSCCEPPSTPLALPGEPLIDWGGALRWRGPTPAGERRCHPLPPATA